MAKSQKRPKCKVDDLVTLNATYQRNAETRQKVSDFFGINADQSRKVKRIIEKSDGWYYGFETNKQFPVIWFDETRRIPWRLTTFLVGSVLIPILAAIIQIGGATRTPIIIPDTPSFDVPSESLTVSYTNIEPLYSTKFYSGTIRLVVKGFGSAGGNQSSDAFYIFENNSGQTTTQPYIHGFGLELDGKNAFDVVDAIPPFSKNHIYDVVYDVGSVERRISFRIRDYYVVDNEGGFSIDVYAMH